jgi:uncharacterized lipoprotein YehR (DUF1307 family)
MQKNNVLFCLIVLLFSSIALLGCLNYEQIVKINKDGSGSIKIHYWAQGSDVMAINDRLSLSFDENEIRNEQYEPLTVTNVITYKDKKDSALHVYVELDFEDIDQLTSIQGFAGNSIKFFQENDNIKLVHDLKFFHIIKQDSGAYAFGMDEYALKYSYEFNSYPIGVDSLGIVKDEVITLEYKYSGIGQSDKDDIIMTALIKNDYFKIILIYSIVGFTITLSIFIRMLKRRKKQQNKL